MDQEEIDTRFTYHPPRDDHEIAVHANIRRAGKDLAETLAMLLPPSRELSLAITNVEQAVMWANAAVARHRLPQ